MKLPVDENLSHRLVPALQDAFCGTTHAQELGLKGETDATIWAYAGREGFAPVSKADHFRQITLLSGAPPKVIVLAVGNGGNAAALSVLTVNRSRIEAFDADAQENLLVLRAAPA